MFQETLHVTHLLKWLDMMYEYEMDPTRTVGTTERTRDAGRTDGWMDGRTDGWTDEVKPIYPPTTLFCRGYNDKYLAKRSRDLIAVAPLNHQRPITWAWSLRADTYDKKWFCDTSPPPCVIGLPHLKWFGQTRKKPQSRQCKTLSDLCYLDLWPFILKMVHDTLSPHVLYVCHIWSDSPK